jgi:hypothetical protein
MEAGIDHRRADELLVVADRWRNFDTSAVLCGRANDAR